MTAAAVCLVYGLIAGLLAVALERTGMPDCTATLVGLFFPVALPMVATMIAITALLTWGDDERDAGVR